VFKERPTKKLMERYIGLYAIEKIVSMNTVKLQLSSSMRIHLVVNSVVQGISKGTEEGGRRTD